ncbi:MAG: hypothetical protein ACXVA6_22685 [Isosphaeraceae bacterium]
MTAEDPLASCITDTTDLNSVNTGNQTRDDDALGQLPSRLPRTRS